MNHCGCREEMAHSVDKAGKKERIYEKRNHFYGISSNRRSNWGSGGGKNYWKRKKESGEYVRKAFGIVPDDGSVGEGKTGGQKSVRILPKDGV